MAVTPQEALAAGQITPAQYMQLQGKAFAGSLAGAGLSLPPSGAPGAAAPPPAAPVFDPNAAPQRQPMTPMPPPGTDGTVPNPHYSSPVQQAQAAAAAQGVPVTAPSMQAAAGAKPRNLVVVGGAPGVAEAQGVAPAADPLASILRPQAGGAAHAVGYSPADKSYIGKLGQEEAATQQQQIDNANRVQEAAGAFANQSSALAADSQKGLLDYTNSIKENDERKAALSAETEKKWGALQSEIADMQANGVNPNRYFQDQSTGQKIIGALAIGFGAFGASLTHGPNTALEIMNNAIARDVDAQKTNLAHSLDFEKFKASAATTGFDHQKAFLEAQRDSIQSAYAVAMSETAKRAALYKDNADVQTKAAQIHAGLQESAQQKVDQINQQIYGVQKGAERVVGGGGQKIDPKAIAEEADKWVQSEAAAGRSRTVAEGHAHAVENLYGAKLPGYDTTTTAKPGSAGKLSPRLAARMAMLDAHAGEADELDKIMQKGSSLSPSDRARAEALAEGLRNDGYKSVPEKPLEVISNTGAHRAGLDEVRKSIERQRASLKKYGTGTGAEAGDATGDDGNPAGLEREDQ